MVGPEFSLQGMGNQERPIQERESSSSCPFQLFRHFRPSLSFLLQFPCKRGCLFISLPYCIVIIRLGASNEQQCCVFILPYSMNNWSRIGSTVKEINFRRNIVPPYPLERFCEDPESQSLLLPSVRLLFRFFNDEWENPLSEAITYNTVDKTPILMYSCVL